MALAVVALMLPFWGNCLGHAQRLLRLLLVQDHTGSFFLGCALGARASGLLAPNQGPRRWLLARLQDAKVVQDEPVLDLEKTLVNFGSPTHVPFDLLDQITLLALLENFLGATAQVGLNF